MSIKTIKIPSKLDAQRVDLAIVELVSELSRSKVRKLLDAGQIYINDKRVWIAKYKLKAGDQVKITNIDNFESDWKLKPEHILFENTKFIVINKPAGMIVEDTLHNYPILKSVSYLTKVPESSLFVVHRLDKETSGVMIVAKSEEIQRELVSMWSDKKVKKTYIAICMNIPEQESATIDERIGQYKNRNQYATGVSKGFREAVTGYQTQKVSKDKTLSLIECYPKTGRSHQLRVHLTSIGCPILGDKVYANKYTDHKHFHIATRQLLHALNIEFCLFGKDYKFNANIPKDISELIEKYM